VGYFVPGEESLLEFDVSKAGPGIHSRFFHSYDPQILLHMFLFMNNHFPGYLQSEVLTQYGEVKTSTEHTDRRSDQISFFNITNIWANSCSRI